jgi:hypothetical protein
MLTGAAGLGAALGATTTGAATGAGRREGTFSTTTALVRPCEKLCLTISCPAGRFKVSVPLAGMESGLSLVLVLSSVMRLQFIQNGRRSNERRPRPGKIRQIETRFVGHTDTITH